MAMVDGGGGFSLSLGLFKSKGFDALDESVTSTRDDV